MRYALETIFVISIGHVGVISGISVTSHGNLSRCAFSGSKLPLYVLLKAPDSDNLEGFDSSGTPIPSIEIEARCPGFTRRFLESSNAHRVG